MELQVWYTVPVAAHVDTETGEVTRVVVIDDAIKPEKDRPFGGPSDTQLVTLPDYSDRAPAHITERAVEIAESQVWPVWENGY